MQPSPRVVVLPLALLLLASACGQAQDTATAPSTAVGSQPPASAAADPLMPGLTATPQPTATFDQTVPAGEEFVVREVGRRPHDTTAFTQGLEFDEGQLFESRGLYANQEDVVLTEIDPTDGSPVRELPRDAADGDYFAEGLTVVGDRIIQITWQTQVAYVYDRDTFERTGEYTYEGEGWGLCDEPDRLVMSNGTPTLTFRDLDTFEPLGTVEVTLDGQPVDELNEIECVGGLVWANVWRTDTIVVIDPATGVVVSTVDASGLLSPEEEAQADVLNGIAYDAATDTWLLTGKLWPWMFEVEFDCTAGCEGAPIVTPSHYSRRG